MRSFQGQSVNVAGPKFLEVTHSTLVGAAGHVGVTIPTSEGVSPRPALGNRRYARGGADSEVTLVRVVEGVNSFPGGRRPRPDPVRSCRYRRAENRPHV
jgi:hypothetical protein